MRMFPTQLIAVFVLVQLNGQSPLFHQLRQLLLCFDSIAPACNIENQAQVGRLYWKSQSMDNTFIQSINLIRFDHQLNRS